MKRILSKLSKGPSRAPTGRYGWEMALRSARRPAWAPLHNEQRFD